MCYSSGDKINAALQASVGNVTGAANSISGAMGDTDGFLLGPRARFITPLFIKSAVKPLALAMGI